jgi:serine/threonine protein phosphatase PrpC
LEGTVKSRGFGQSHIGGRKNNEDAFLASETLGLYVVADGMGGYEGGEIASQMTVEGLHRFFDIVGPEGEVGMSRAGSGGRMVADDMMRLAIRQASHDIEKVRHGRLASMGSTVAAVLIREGRALIAHVGDSRVYRTRRGILERMTRDHSLYAELEEAGVISVGGLASRNVITRAVGVPGYAMPDVTIVDTQPGDTFLMCSDGLTDDVPDGDIAEVLAAFEPKLAAQQLVHRAWHAGASDNITCVVARVG